MSKAIQRPTLHYVGAFDDLATKRIVVITTYERDGSAVPTAVNVVVQGVHGQLVPLAHRLRTTAPFTTS